MNRTCSQYRPLVGHPKCRNTKRLPCGESRVGRRGEPRTVIAGSAVHRRGFAYVGFLVISCIAQLGGCSAEQPDVFVDAVRGEGKNNLDMLRQKEPEVPPVEQWWIEQPRPDELIEALVPPAESESQICVKRIWIPREIDPLTNFDESLVDELEVVLRGPHYAALLSHYYESKGDIGRSEKYMDLARTSFVNQPWTGMVHMSYRTNKLLAALFSLDWIRWRNAREFELAFALCRKMVQEHLPVAGFRDHGYWMNDSNIEHSDMVATLLAICVCNVNPSGESTKWAKDHLSRLQKPRTDPQSVYSPFEFANVMSLVGRKGGGREMGQKRIRPGYGGYESYFSCSAIVQFKAVDTATNDRWNLTNRSLYINSRPLGLEFEQDRTVAHTGLDPVAAAILQVMAKLADNERSAGVYQWILRDDEPNTKLLELQCLAGPKPEPVSPDSGPATRSVGSRWHYREDPSQPNSTFRVWIANRDLENYRVGVEERCLSFCIGNIGLVDAHTNRTYVVGALANGIQFAQKNDNGEPFIADPNFWPTLANHHPYWSTRAYDATTVLNDPRHLIDVSMPEQKDGVWTWTRDFSNVMTRDQTSGIVGKVSHAQSQYNFSPAERKLQIVDTIRADKDIYIGWHFSPSHGVEITENGFRFGDGRDEIHVTIQGLNGVEFDLKRRQQWLHDGYSLPLDWHGSLGGPKRVAENIGYTPKSHQSEYQVHVTIQANPNK